MGYLVMGRMRSILSGGGGGAKIALRRAVTTGEFFPSATACTEFLHEKFKANENPTYYVREKYQECLQISLLHEI